MMIYALNLAADCRVLSATYAQYASENMVLADSLPEGDVNDYRYTNGAYVFDPLPATPTSPPVPTLEQRTAAIEDAVAELILGGRTNV